MYGKMAQTRLLESGKWVRQLGLAGTKHSVRLPPVRMANVLIAEKDPDAGIINFYQLRLVTDELLNLLLIDHCPFLQGKSTACDGLHLTLSYRIH